MRFNRPKQSEQIDLYTASYSSTVGSYRRYYLNAPSMLVLATTSQHGIRQTLNMLESAQDEKLRTVKSLSHLSVVELSAAKITIKLQQLPPSYRVVTLHKALIFFTVHTLK